MENLARAVCAAPECGRLSRTAGLCDMHYKRQKRNGHLGRILPERPPTCTIPGCDQPHRAQGYCHPHYRKWAAARVRAERRANMPTPLPDKPGEEWRPVVGYEGIYEVSDAGRVRSVPRVDAAGRVRAPKIKAQSLSNGYRFVLLFKNRKQRAARVHVLVAAAFLGPRPPGLVVNHIDHDKTNNQVGNLEYVTQRENIQAAVRAGRFGARD